MKISTRLSLLFSLIASTIFIASGFTVYFFSARFQKLDFQERLKDRIEITEKIFLEKETFTRKEFEKIRKQFLHTLPQETEEVVELGNLQTLKFKHNYPPQLKEKLLQEKPFYLKNSEVQGRSKIFHVNGKNFLIVVTAIDQVGGHYLSNLRNIIALLILVGIPLIILGSYFIAHRALLPLSNKIDKANSISASNLHLRLNIINPNDEIGKLAIAFNKLLDRLESAFETQKAFIRNASHEIRNPLTVIMGEAEIAISKPRSKEEYVESLGVVIKEAETLNATVTNLLHLSKITASESEIKYENFEFANFIMEVNDGFNYLNPENKLEIKEVKTNADTILGNKNLLKTAILNLFDNACKFSANGKVEIKINAKNEQIKMSIKDCGIGIDEKDLEKIFTPFYRGNNALSIKGSGIGLALTIKIIKLHKGKLEIKSELKKGTEVILFLPLAQA